MAAASTVNGRLKMLISRYCRVISLDLPRRAYDVDKPVDERKDPDGVAQRCHKDDEEDGLCPVKLYRLTAAYLRSQKEKDRKNRGLLEDLDHESHELPLRHDCKASGIRQRCPDYARAVDLVDVRQAQKEQYEEVEPPVPRR